MRASNRSVSRLGVFIWLLAAVFYLYEFFLRTFVGSIAPELIHDLRLTVSEFTVIGAAYYVSYGLMQLPVGLLVDRFGVKKSLAYSAALCVLSVVVFAKATYFMPAICGRVLMGVGSSFAFVSLLLIVSNWFPKRLFGLFSGISILVGTMGPALAGGPLISLLNDAHMGWRTALNMMAIAGVFITVLIACFVRCKPAVEQSSVPKREPLLPQLKQLMRNKKTWFIALYNGGMYVSMAVMAAVWGTEYLDARGFSQSASAYMISTAWLAYAVACPGYGFLVDITKRRKPFMLLSALLGMISMGLIIHGSYHSELADELLFILLGFSAAGSSLSYGAVIEANDPKLKASALGLNNAIGMLMGAIAPVLIGVLVSVSDGSSDAAHIPVQAMGFGLSLLPLLYFVALLLAAFCIKDETSGPLLPALIQALKMMIFHPKARLEER